MLSNFRQYNNPTRRTRFLRNRAASRIQNAARRTRITKSLYGQFDEFLKHLSKSPNVILLEILSVNPPNPPNTITLMVDTRTRGGATKRMLLCIDIGADRKILDINANCIKDRMPRGGLAFTRGHGSRYTEMGPSPYGGPSILGHVNLERLVNVQNQLRKDFMTKRRGFFQYSPNVRTRYPLVTKLGLDPQELLDILEPNYCVYPIFKKICKDLRQKIKDGEIYYPSPEKLEVIQEAFSKSDDVINVTNAVPVTSSDSTKSYSDEDFNILAGLVAGNWNDDVAAVISPPQLSPYQLFLDDESWGSDGPPPSPPRLQRSRRRTPPPNSPPARRARRF